MRILIIEDEPLYADQLEILCEQLGYEVIATCPDAFSALDAFHRTQPDLLLSDINLEGAIAGIQLAEKLNAAKPTPTIFITSLQDDATFARARAVLPVAFMIKPFDRLQLQRQIELAVAALARKSSSSTPTDFNESDVKTTDSFFVKVKNRLEKVRIVDIVYVEADGRYAMLHTQKNRKFAVRIPLSELEQQLAPANFLRSHRSYLFQLDLLDSLDAGEMVIKVAGHEIPLSKGYKEGVLARINQL